jgi:hypothetical protein
MTTSSQVQSTIRRVLDDKRDMPGRYSPTSTTSKTR